MATISVRGRHIKIAEKIGRQRSFAIDQYFKRTDETLDRLEAEDFPDRAILRKIINHVDAAEQLSRSLLYDLVDRAEREANEDPEFVPDYVNDDGEGMLYPENVAPLLDGVAHRLWEIWMDLKEELDNPDEVKS